MEQCQSDLVRVAGFCLYDQATQLKDRRLIDEPTVVARIQFHAQARQAAGVDQ